MDSSSRLTPCNYKFNVFASFHGPDVRKTLLSHIREQFNRSGITMFDDQEIVRSATIAPSLTEAIRESRISIVILSKKYASSSWCLDELVEILECKRAMGQIVMTIFYGVDPSEVRKQSGEFEIAFKKTCARETDEERQKWSKALNDVANIAGEDFLRWNNEANMIEKIARNVSDKLNATPSRDFDGMVGLGSHLREMVSLLELDNDGVKIVAITGPAGIGKTTIARALQSQLSDKFQLTCFVDNVRGSYHSGLDDYGLQLRLQEQFLSKALNLNGMRICHLGAVKQNLCDKRVLIILDDVNNIKQLEALANETSWFGPGSRIVVTTENKELLQQHGINNAYHVKFPSAEEALEILCRYAFKQNSPPHGFEELAESITYLCGKLPLGLRVVGSSLRGKNEEGDWKYVMDKLETNIGPNIERVLSVGYESLDEDDQILFLHIAVFFNYKDSDHVEAMFAGCDLDVRRGLKNLVNRSLIEMSTYGETIVMHSLLQQVGRKAIRRQKPWDRQILIDANDICDALQNVTGTGKVSGISFDILGINKVFIRKGAFERMWNLRFLSIYKRRRDGNNSMDIPENMEFPTSLRTLHWEAYPRKSLPPTFHPEYLIELDMKYSKLEKLWEGIQPLANLKMMNLTCSRHLKELPDLSNAINLETLLLSYCENLVELPSSISDRHKLKTLWMESCTKLEGIPTNWNLKSLKSVNISGTNITTFDISVTSVKEEPVSFTLRYRRQYLLLDLRYNGKLKTLTQLPTYLSNLDLSCSGIERISNCCIKGLYMLHTLTLSCCRKLTSLPELPASLQFLDADDCESLETIVCPSDTSYVNLNFTNCFNLGEQARREIIQQRSLQYWSSYLPGSEMPKEFHHRAVGNTLAFPLSAFSYFKVCLLISPNQKTGEEDDPYIFCRRIRKGFLYPVEEIRLCRDIPSTCQTKHLFIFSSDLLDERGGREFSRDMMFEFSSKCQDFDIIECGAQIMTYEAEGSNNWGLGDEDGGSDTCESVEASDEQEDKDDSITSVGRSESESKEVSDDEEGYTNKSTQVSKDKTEDITDGDYEYVSRKRPRKTTMTIAF